jgi:hypothetical protein
MWDQLARFAAGSTWQAASFGGRGSISSTSWSAPAPRGAPRARPYRGRRTPLGQRRPDRPGRRARGRPRPRPRRRRPRVGGLRGAALPGWGSACAARGPRPLRDLGGGTPVPQPARAAKADDPAAALRSQTRWRRLKKDMELWLRRQTVALERALREGPALAVGPLPGALRRQRARPRPHHRSSSSTSTVAWPAWRAGAWSTSRDGASMPGPWPSRTPAPSPGWRARWAEDLADHRLVPLLRQLDREPPRPASEQERARYRLLRSRRGGSEGRPRRVLVALGGSPRAGGDPPAPGRRRRGAHPDRPRPARGDGGPGARVLPAAPADLRGSPDRGGDPGPRGGGRAVARRRSGTDG